MKYIQVEVPDKVKENWDLYLQSLTAIAGTRVVTAKELGNYLIDKELNSKAYKRLIKR